MRPKRKRAAAQVRQSQMLTTYGPGSMVDLPRKAVIIGGLDHWHGRMRLIHEPRLAAKVATALGRPTVELKAPPEDRPEADAPASGVVARVFPEWFVAQYEEDRGGNVRSRPLLHRERLVRGQFQDQDKKMHPVVPVRFVQACVRGHIGDIRWYRFVHQGANCHRGLWLDERGTSGDLAEVYVRCDCGATRSLGDAGDPQGRALGSCEGLRPWLGPAAGETCGGPEGKPQPNRLLMRTATNAYFAQVLRVISIPESDQLVAKAVDGVWEDFLQFVESREDVAKERRRATVHRALEGLTDDRVWEEIQRRRGPTTAPPRSIKELEIETLLSSEDEIGDDVPDSDFYARRRRPDPSTGPAAKLDRVVLVHRLREVQAQLGFTRFEAEMPDIQGELALDVRRAELALDVRWVPAVENRGEGVFLAFRKNEIDDWCKEDGASRRGQELEQAFERWREAHPGSRQEFPGLPYILLHSLSHLLITQLALVCGYAASSIRERIYAGSSSGYGILLYTGTSDAEGTLGGLVQVGRELERHLEDALELGRLCSNDPVCAVHAPTVLALGDGLMGSACHGCLLIAEPSCERRNEFLDRALVVRTVADLGAEFFRQS